MKNAQTHTYTHKYIAILFHIPWIHLFHCFCFAFFSFLASIFTFYFLICLNDYCKMKGKWENGKIPNQSHFEMFAIVAVVVFADAADFYCHLATSTFIPSSAVVLKPATYICPHIITNIYTIYLQYYTYMLFICVCGAVCSQLIHRMWCEFLISSVADCCPTPLRTQQRYSNGFHHACRAKISSYFLWFILIPYTCAFRNNSTFHFSFLFFWDFIKYFKQLLQRWMKR